MKREEIADRLAAAGRRRTAAMEARREASREIAELIPRAQRAGMGVAEIVRLTGMSKRGVYDIVERTAASSPSAERVDEPARRGGLRP